MSDELNDRIAQRITKLLELEGSMVRELAAARYELMDAQEEIRAGDQKAIEARFEYFTEQQFAARLQVSHDTIAKLRRARKIPFVQLRPGLFRYTTAHLVEVARRLEVRDQKSEVSGRRLKLARAG